MHKVVLTLFFTVLLKFCSGQEYAFIYYNDSGAVNKIAEAKYTRQIATRGRTYDPINIKDCFISGEPYLECSYKTNHDYEFDIKFGIFTWYYKNGNKCEEDNYRDNLLNGISTEWFENGNKRCEKYFVDGNLVTVKMWWENGKLKRDDVFEDNKLKSGRCFNFHGIEVSHYDFENPFPLAVSFLKIEDIEVMPVFPGGDIALMEYLKRNIMYPKKAKRKGITGTTYIKFIVDWEGNAVDVKISRSSNILLDEEAKRVVSNMPKWFPGIVNKKPVSVLFTLPIKFTLN